MGVLDQTILAFVQRLLLASAAMVPVAFVAWRLARQRRVYDEATLPPFTELPLRPPGESVRERLEKTRDHYDSVATTMVLCGAVGAALLSTFWGRWLAVGMVFAVMTGAIALEARKLRRILRDLWNLKLGYMGERVVGEELNQLLAAGFRVFHDLPFDGFNIDHVIVGPVGVFAVETKAKRKPADIKGTARATLVFDGRTLHFPKGYDEKPVEQARLNARTLSEWLTSATGDIVPVKPILTYPGWWIDRKAVSDVNVLNPSEIKRSFPSKVVLSREQIQRICHQLTERCRLPEPA